MTEFFNMGGYAFYIWTAYGLALSILIWNVLSALRKKQQTLNSLARRFRQNQEY